MIDQAACGCASFAVLSLAFLLGCAESRGSEGATARAAITPSTDLASCEDPGTRYRRTELFLGLSKPGRAPVTGRQFAAFLQDVVTPRFPAGFTVLEGHGQSRDRHGAIVQEDARIVVLLYDALDRAAYAQAFRQESVRCADGSACVSFYA